MVGARLEGRAERLARGLRIPPNGWREANIALDGGARLILRSMVAQGQYPAQWWREANIVRDGGARLISHSMVARS